MANLLDVEGLRTHIRMRHSSVEAVDGVSLTIRQGETVGLVGESGCGKSITGLSIMRLLPPGGRIVGGSIKLAGQEITALAEPEMARLRGNDVAMIFQDPMTSLDPTMTIGDQIAEPVRAHQDRLKEGGAGTGRGGAEPGRHAEAARAPEGFPASAVGRSSPARDDRDGPGLRT